MLFRSAGLFLCGEIWSQVAKRPGARDPREGGGSSLVGAQGILPLLGCPGRLAAAPRPLRLPLARSAGPALLCLRSGPEFPFGALCPPWSRRLSGDTLSREDGAGDPGPLQGPASVLTAVLGKGVDLTLLHGPAWPVLLGDRPPPGKGCAPCGCLCRDEGLGHGPGAWRLSLTAQTCLSRDAGRRRLALRTRGLGREAGGDRKSTRLNSSHRIASRMPSSA